MSIISFPSEVRVMKKMCYVISYFPQMFQFICFLWYTKGFSCSMTAAAQSSDKQTHYDDSAWELQMLEAIKEKSIINWPKNQWSIEQAANVCVD